MSRPLRACGATLAALTLTLPLAACGDDGTAAPQPNRLRSDHSTSRGSASAELRDAGGTVVGHVALEDSGEGTRVTVETDGLGGAPGFHGFHVHANDDPGNGEGCRADPAATVDTWFAAVDGHLRSGDQLHGGHQGDLPSLLVGDGGTGRMSFVTDRFAVADVAGRAVVVHAGPDNFGNVPVGPGADQYTANSPAALEATQLTGNSGHRIACGLITTDS